ncbi:glycosyltransferase family 4 protein [Oxalobacteraceae bacterium OM1]|nr:glycosyltransferase family 4 protein [Oxalobacteraceae bacterium OM1]
MTLSWKNQLKLLFFIYSLGSGGAERVTANLANHWARKGWDVTLVTLASHTGDFFALDPAIRRVSLGLAAESSNPLAGAARNARRVLALRRTLKRVRCDVAISMMSTSNVILALASLGMNGVCAIGSERVFPPRLPLGRIWEIMRTRTYGGLAAVVALTQECADWLKANTLAVRVPVIPNAVPWPLPEQPPKLNPAALSLAGKKILLAAGRLSPQKNFEALIEAFAEVASRHPDWRVVIVGEGPQRPALEERVRRHGLCERVLLPGGAGNMADWYGLADLFVLSSRFEGFPNVLAEAMAHGLPAVSFDCDTGPRDIIRNGVDGILVPSGDVPGLGRAIEHLMAGDALRARMASSASDARSRFSVERIASQWEGLFDTLRGGRPLQARPAAGSARKDAACAPLSPAREGRADASRSMDIQRSGVSGRGG